MRYLHEIIVEGGELEAFTGKFSLRNYLPVPECYAKLQEIDVFLYYLFAGTHNQAQTLHESLGLDEQLTWPSPTRAELEQVKENWPDYVQRAKRAAIALAQGAATEFSWKENTWGGPNDLSRLDWELFERPRHFARARFRSQCSYIKGLQKLNFHPQVVPDFRVHYAVFDTRERILSLWAEEGPQEPETLASGEMLECVLEERSRLPWTLQEHAGSEEIKALR